MPDTIGNIISAMRALESQRSSLQAKLANLLAEKSEMERQGKLPTNLSAISLTQSQIRNLDNRIDALKAQLK